MLEKLKSGGNLRISKNVIIKAFNKDVFFILNKANAKQYDLTQMEYEIIKGIEEKKSLNKIAEEIEKDYKTEGFESVKQDVSDFIDDLLNAGILERI